MHLFFVVTCGYFTIHSIVAGIKTHDLVYVGFAGVFSILALLVIAAKK